MNSAVLDPANPDLIADPYPTLARLRSEGPLVPVAQDLWAVTRYRDIVDVLSRPEDFSSSQANLPPTDPDPVAVAIRKKGWPLVPALLTADPPAHARHRRIVQQAFNGRRISQLTNFVSATIDELIDSFAESGRVELRTQFAEPLPLAMITSAIGLPHSDIDRVHRWSDAVVARVGRSLSPDEQRRVAEENVELQGYLVEAIRLRRTLLTDDLLSDVAAASEADDDPLTMSEMLTILEQVLVAGNETTTRLIVFAAHRLATDTRLQAWLRLHPDLVPPFLEEVLRIESPVQSKIRVATRDTEVGGEPVTTGTRVLVHLGAGNHDPDVFPHPERLDLSRPNLRDHLAFGYGRHFCVGATLARTEARLAVARLLDRFQHIELAPDTPVPSYEASLVHRGLDHLHLRLS